MIGLATLLVGVAGISGVIPRCSRACSSSEYCVCNKDFCQCLASIDEIADCVSDSLIPGNIILLCFLRGICVENNCQCSRNYDGSSLCETCILGFTEIKDTCVNNACVYVNEQRATECNDHGKCILSDPGNVCSCDDGFVRLGTNICVYDVCVVDKEAAQSAMAGDINLPCGGFGKCFETGCVCNQGYRKPYCIMCAPSFLPAMSISPSQFSSSLLACINKNCLPPTVAADAVALECSGAGFCKYYANTHSYSCACMDDYLPYETSCYYKTCFQEGHETLLCNNAGLCISGVCHCWGTHLGKFCTECNKTITVTVDGKCLAKACITKSGPSLDDYVLCSNNGNCIYKENYRDMECLCNPVEGDKINGFLNNKCQISVRSESFVWLYTTFTVVIIVIILAVGLFFAIRRCRYKYVAEHRVREFDPNLIVYY